MTTMAWVTEWAGQLAELSDDIITKVPEAEEFNVVRHFLQNTSSVLRRGDVKAGVKAIYQLLPYIQRGLSSVEKSMNIGSTYEITETISQHFLVDESAREELTDFLAEIKVKVADMNHKVDRFARELDRLLDEVVVDGRTIGLVLTLKLAFQMNRITAQIHTCEDLLAKARHMIDTLDTHVAGKTFLATALSYITFLVGLGFGATGNLPASAACFTAATASRKSAKNLDEYRSQLAKVDREHRALQTQLTEWKHRFRGEQTNFLLLVGLQRALISIAILGVAFFFLGKAANFMVFAMIFMYLVVKSEETNSFKYYAAIGLGLVAMFIEYEKHYGMAIFNLLSCVLIGLNYLGFVEV